MQMTAADWATLERRVDDILARVLSWEHELRPGEACYLLMYADLTRRQATLVSPVRDIIRERDALHSRVIALEQKIAHLEHAGDPAHWHRGRVRRNTREERAAYNAGYNTGYQAGKKGR